MGTGRMNSARALRFAVKVVRPKSRAKNVLTGALAVTPRIRLFTASGAAVTTTPFVPFAYPFLVASASAAVDAPVALVGRYTTPASAAASAARCTRIMFTSNQAMSVTRPMKPKSAVSISATMTRVWPRSPRRKLFRDIHRHHGAVRDLEQIEEREEEFQRCPRAVGVADRDAHGVDWCDVRAGAGQPRLACLDEVERVTVDDRTAVRQVRPDVDEVGSFRPARR